jgi:hypothetical protein
MCPDADAITLRSKAQRTLDSSGGRSASESGGGIYALIGRQRVQRAVSRPAGGMDGE